MTETVRRHAAALAPEELPAYVYDLAALRAHAAVVRAALPDRVELYYAAKANPEAPVLAALRDAVDGYEVSSGGELAHVRAAVPGAPLAFGGPGKTPAEIAAAVDAGVHRWHVESEQELHRLDAVLADRPGTVVDVLLRVNLPVTTGALDEVALAMGGRPTPFGLDPEQAEECVRLLTAGADGDRHGDRHGDGVGRLGRRLRLRGVHAHLASGLAAAEQLAVAGQIVAWSAALAERHGFPLTEVNIGGGMAVDYDDPTEHFDWKAFGEGLDELLGDRPGLTLRIEPGRALTAHCGWYATEVLDVKQSHGEDFAVVRGGTHHLRTPATRGHSQPFEVLPVEDWPHPWPRPAVTTGRATLAGQLCTPKDVLARAADGADGLRAADRVLFAMAGAYAWNISHHEFLMHPRPGFHYLGG
ncbi:type III PLP-dependent enzyme [Kitasatospora sp. NPDC004745]|uniref:type III PLP-dependent enzyme n=1 Tax=Kitasatospora sp. NPDC004745 TaxID=3364019 RepID=UPI0036B4BF27